MHLATGAPSPRTEDGADPDPDRGTADQASPQGAPGPFGLPSLWAVLWFPLVTFAGMLVLVALGISGSSTGVWHSLAGSGPDPDLISGAPRPIRSDEWLVQSGWALSQVRQGFPAVNGTFPGGMDATLMNDLPTTDWSTAFRPHVWGFLVLPLDQGFALRWWLPGWSLLAGAYAFAVTLLPRHRVASALLAVAVFFSPLLQWSWMPTTLWPVAFGFVTMTAVWWALHGGSSRAKWLWSALAAWSAVAMIMSIYVPYMVASALVVVAFTLGAVLVSRREHGPAATLRNLVPLGVCAGVALAVTVVWVYTRRETVAAILGTVYPGARLEQTGALELSDSVSVLGAPFSGAFLNGVRGALGANETEGAAPFMLALFLLVPLIAIAVDRAHRKVDWVAVATIAVAVVIVVFWLVPGWDSAAHLLLLDRAPAQRFRLSLLLLGVVAFALVARAQLRRPESRVPMVAGVIAVLVTVGLNVWVWLQLRAEADPVLSNSWRVNWKITVGLLVLVVALLMLRQITLAAVVLAVVTLAVAGRVNPLYHGVYDLAETNAGRAVTAVDASAPGVWLGVGGRPPMAVLMETGVEAFNGIQTYPPTQMWQAIDPAGTYETQWNRLGHVMWLLEPGEPRWSNPYPDVIMGTFDPCSHFAQQHVDYVLSDAQIASSCLVGVTSTTDGPFGGWIYRVAPVQ
jgi:hypothetical protein